MVATPGRLIDVLTASNGKITNLHRVSFVALDEADRMFDMGFAPQIEMIMDRIQPRRQTCMFSATFPVHIQALAAKCLKKPIQITVGKAESSKAFNYPSFRYTNVILVTSSQTNKIIVETFVQFKNLISLVVKKNVYLLCLKFALKVFRAELFLGQVNDFLHLWDHLWR